MSNVIDSINSFVNVSSLYDSVRIVNPICKEVMRFDQSKSVNIKECCYSIWKKNSSCKNCTAVRAIRENRTLIKFEYIDDNVFVLVTYPIKIEEELYAVELLKDITDVGFISSDNSESSFEFAKVLNDLHSLAIKDELTGMYNRRYINEILPRDIAKSELNSKPVSVILADIDNFKVINDKYGHIAGDGVLEKIARNFINSIRKGEDWVARYGGEEFLIVLNNCSGEDAFKVAESIRKSIEKSEFKHKKDIFKVTMSFGVACFNNENISLKKVIDITDKNLYEAKKNGKNQTVYK